jgi:hypothetical protein
MFDYNITIEPNDNTNLIFVDFYIPMDEDTFIDTDVFVSCGPYLTFIYNSTYAETNLTYDVS